MLVGVECTRCGLAMDPGVTIAGGVTRIHWRCRCGSKRPVRADEVRMWAERTLAVFGPSPLQPDECLYHGVQDCHACPHLECGDNLAGRIDNAGDDR